MLSEGQYESCMRIAVHCARAHQFNQARLSIDDRRDAALTGMLEEIHENGFPDDRAARPLFRAAANAIDREEYEHAKHLQYWGYWLPPKTAHADPMERVIERIAVWEICWAMTDAEWSAVWALGEAYRRGGSMAEAAALLGINEARFVGRLVLARKRGRRLWVAPGEHVGGMYRPARRGERTRFATWQYNQRRSVRNRLAS